MSKPLFPEQAKKLVSLHNETWQATNANTDLMKKYIPYSIQIKAGENTVVGFLTVQTENSGLLVQNCNVQIDSAAVKSLLNNCLFDTVFTRIVSVRQLKSFFAFIETSALLSIGIMSVFYQTVIIAKWTNNYVIMFHNLFCKATNLRHHLSVHLEARKIAEKTNLAGLATLSPNIGSDFWRQLEPYFKLLLRIEVEIIEN